MKEYTMQDKSEAMEAITPLINYVNTHSDLSLLTECINLEHRTLQQKCFNVFMDCISKWASAFDKGRYDLRNEFTCKTSKKIMEKLDNEVPYAPFY